MGPAAGRTHSELHARWQAAPGQSLRATTGQVCRRSQPCQRWPGKGHPGRTQGTGRRTRRAALMRLSLCWCGAGSERSCSSPSPCFADLLMKPMDSSIQKLPGSPSSPAQAVQDGASYASQLPTSQACVYLSRRVVQAVRPINIILK